LDREGSVIKAPEDSKVTIAIDGALAELKAGSYKGDIVMTVSKK